MVEWQPQPSDYHRVYNEQNPWWSSGDCAPGARASATERSLAQVLWQRLLHNEPRRHQVILGPRRVGKTTVLYQTVQHLIDNGVDPRRIWWLRMDHPLLLPASLGDLVRALLNTSGATEENPVFLMLDEVVYAGDWDRWLKTFYDERWPVQYRSHLQQYCGASSSSVARAGWAGGRNIICMPCRLGRGPAGCSGGPQVVEAVWSHA